MRCVALLLAIVVSVNANAQVPAPDAPSVPVAPAANAAPPETPMKEVEVAATAFARGTALPAWADVLPVPPAAAATANAGARRPLVIRLDDTHLLAADKPVQLANIAQQVNETSALTQFGQVSIQFIPQYQRLALHKVAILRGDAVIDHTAKVPVRFLQREAGLEQGIYSGVITASLLLPDVRVGDTLWLQYSIEGANPIFGGRYAQNVAWQRPVPVQLRRVTLTAPEARAIQWKWVSDQEASALTPVSSSANGMRRLRFEERELAAVDLEPMMPRGAFPLRWLQFSEFADWADVARWADALFPVDEPLPAELTPLIQRLQRLPSRSEQASQALQWVQNEIRYVSVSLGESSHRPHSPAEVLRNRYGDCKDKSLLLMRILQSVGIPAHAVLASLSSPQGPAKQLATPFAFDHAVVQANIDGRDVMLDPTRLGQRGPVERMGQGLEQASVLVVDGRNTRALTFVHSPNRREIFRNELTETFKLAAFGDDGELDAVQHWVGVGAEAMRLATARMDKQRLASAVLASIERRYPGASVIGTPALTDEAELNRITIHARFKIPKLAAPLDGGWLMRFTPANLQGTVAIPPNMARRFSLGLPAYPSNVAYTVEMQWPTSVSAVVEPVTQRFGTSQFSAEVTRSFRGNVARTSLVFEGLARDIPAKEVPNFFVELRKMERTVGGTLTVSANQVKSGGFLGIGRKTLQDNLRTRAQATVERTGKVIAAGQLGGDDLAQALCLRAEAQLELDQADAALKDAQEALRAAPNFAGAWACHGSVSWARGDFASAETDHGKSLVLGWPAAEAYYRRGLARYYAGKFDAAADDFAKAAADRTDANGKVYPLLWQALALKRVGRTLPATLAGDPAGAWPRPALAMLAGQLTPEQLQEQIARKDGDERELAQAEGLFYIGAHWLAQSQRDKAKEAFEQTRAKGITNTLEHTAAALELQRLGVGKP